jgi:CRP-like cAMP-binding protein
MMDVEKTLRESFLFGDLPSREVRRIAQICSARGVQRGEIVFEEGDEGDSLYVVGRGSIRIFRVLTETYDETLAALGSGEVFGEMSFMDRVPRSSSAVALAPAEIVQLPRAEFDAVLSKQPLLAGKVIQHLARIMATRIRSTDDKLSDAVRWIQEIRQWSEWSLERLPKKATRVEVALHGQGPIKGRLVEITQNQVGYGYLWEEQDGHVAWTPAQALYYLRVRRGEKESE